MLWILTLHFLVARAQGNHVISKLSNSMRHCWIRSNKICKRTATIPDTDHTKTIMLWLTVFSIDIEKGRTSKITRTLFLPFPAYSTQDHIIWAVSKNCCDINVIHITFLRVHPLLIIETILTEFGETELTVNPCNTAVI